MTETYNGCWMVDQQCIVCDTDGKISQDRIENLSSNYQLPEFIVGMHPPNAPCPMMMSCNPEFFNPLQYILLTYQLQKIITIVVINLFINTCYVLILIM